MSRNVFYISYEREKFHHAGAKAPEDIHEICARLNYRPIEVPPVPENVNLIHKRCWQIFYLPYKWNQVTKNIPENSVVIFQYPVFTAPLFADLLSGLRKRKKVILVCLIHDISELRGEIDHKVKDRTLQAERKIFRNCDYFICHNDKMKKYMTDKGMDGEKIVCLNIFDYIADVHKEKSRTKCSVPGVAIAGSMLPAKSEYIYKLFEYSQEKGSALTGNLYGPYFDESRKTANMKYHGSFPPDEVPSKLEGDFGIVWDGNSAQTCAGNTGKYLRYNCPHKTSLYLAAGMPVIIWSQAAMADFVTENGVGLTVDSLENLEEVIASVNDASYARMCENAQKIGKRLREGYYFRTAMDEVLKKLNS